MALTRREPQLKEAINAEQEVKFKYTLSLYHNHLTY